MILDFVEFSASLPSDDEFDCFWNSVLLRMRSKSAATDWGEPDMEKYLRRHILDEEKSVLSAPWRSGLGHVPFGYTTYAPNAIEVSHRVLKGLFQPGYDRRDVGTLIVEVCEAMSTRFVGILGFHCCTGF